LPVERSVTTRTARSFVAALSGLASAFNPYADRCAEHGHHNAARIRRRNLVRYPEAALDTRVDTMWIARDRGYRSVRRTGIPITDEFHFEQVGAMMGGAHLGRATPAPPIAARTSTVMREALPGITRRPRSSSSAVTAGVTLRYESLR
jgi:hypothetical protein